MAPRTGLQGLACHTLPHGFICHMGVHHLALGLREHELRWRVSALAPEHLCPSPAHVQLAEAPLSGFLSDNTTISAARPWSTVFP